MTVIVRNVSSWVRILIFLFGVYIILFGHLTPGGGFAGGVILACAYVLITLAFGGDIAEKNLPRSLVSRLDCIGALMFISIALLGFAVEGGRFFLNFIQQKYMVDKDTAFDLVSAGTMPLLNIAIALKVGASLFLVFLVLSAFKPDQEQDD